MDAPKRPAASDLTPLGRLAARPAEHHVFLALRILEAAHPDAPPLGTARRPRQDRVRLGQAPRMAFPPSTIEAFDPGGEGRPARLTNLFFGLFGPNGPLPLHLTEYARERQKSFRDPTFAAFADMLTHRLFTLLYRAWVTGQPAPAFDRAGRGRIDARIAALSGHAGAAFTDRDAMPDLAKRHFAGLLADGTRNGEGLVAILRSYFSAPVTLQDFVGSWLALEPGDRWQLGAPGGLGEVTCLGARVWSRSAKFRLRIGPVPLAEFERFLPGGPALDRLRAIVRNYLGDALDWDLNLCLAADEVPRARLGGQSRLGHTTWLGPLKPGRAADQLYLHPMRDRPAAA